MPFGKRGRCTTPVQVPECVTYRPTWEEFKDFEKYVEYLESQGAHKAGIVKIVPPPEWVPRKEGYDLDGFNFTIETPVKQHFKVVGEKGSYQTKGLIQQPISVKEYENLANSGVYKTPHHSSHEELERKYWKTLSFCPPVYGCDVPDSITDNDQEVWNIRHLKTILDLVNDEYNQQFKGVNTPYLYFGMWKATFSWHVEDMDLHSINYLHYGAPKTWYCVPPQYGYLLEAAARKLYPHVAEWCSNFMRHKTCLISPHILDKLGVPYQKVVQEQRNVIIVFPYAYHSGFNHGFNIAESTNFALKRWIEYGKRARQCDCQRSRVMFSMDAFVKKFQPELWEAWKQGIDIKPHPEDPPKVIAEFQLRIAKPKEYARMKQDRFLKRNFKYKSQMRRSGTCPILDLKTSIAQNDSSQNTKICHVYQHHEYSNVKITIDPDSMTVLGKGKDLLEKFLDADSVDINALVEKCVLIRIGEKSFPNLIQTNLSVDSESPNILKTLIHVYRHIELGIEARVNSETLELDGPQAPELNEYLKNDKVIKDLISLGIFTFSYEDPSIDKTLKSSYDSNVTDKDKSEKKIEIEEKMGTLGEQNDEKTMEIMECITGHIYRDMTSKEMVMYLPKCQKFVGTIAEKIVHLVKGKSINDLVEEGKFVKVGERRLCPEVATSLMKEKVRLNRTVLNIKVGNTDHLLKVEVATHNSVSNRVVFVLSSNNTDQTKYEDAKRALENNPVKNLLDENILVKAQNTCSSIETKMFSAKGDMLLSALQHECKIVKCTNHVNETKTMSSIKNSSNESKCKCSLKGILKLRNSMVGSRTKTGAKSIIVQVQEYSSTVSIENRPSDELYIVKECRLPPDIATEEYESEDEAEVERKQNSRVSTKITSEYLSSNSIQTRKKRKVKELDEIRDPYDSEAATDASRISSDECKENQEESSDDPDYGDKRSKSYQWKSKKASKKKTQKKLVPAATRVGVPGFVLEKRRDSEEKRSSNKSKRNLNRTNDMSLLSTANALINYFEDDENLDEDFNLIFYSKDLARKLDQEPSNLLDVLKLFQEFQIVTRVMKKPQDREQPRYEWNGIEDINVNAVLSQIYLEEKNTYSDKKDQSELWKVCVDLLRALTRSRRGERHTVYNLTDYYSVNEIKNTIQVFSVLESLKLIEKKTFNCGQFKQTCYLYIGPDILGKELETLYMRWNVGFGLKRPKLSLIQEDVSQEKFFPYLHNDDEQMLEGLILTTTNNDDSSSNTEEKIRSLANKNRVCQCGYDKRMEVKVNRDGQNAYFKKTVRTGFKKRSRCKQCKGCLASKCGKCTPCLRPAMKKPCVDKICLFPVVPKCPCFS